MKKLKYVIIIFVALTLVVPAIGQTITEQVAKEELAKRGLADQEERIQQELLKRGIDINNVDSSNPLELKKVQDAMDEIIKEIEQEKKEKQANREDKNDNGIELDSDGTESIGEENSKTKVDDKDVIEAVKKGSTIDEAIADQIHENEEQALPIAQTYGQHIFRSQSVKFYKKSSDAKAPSSYVLGPDDKIAISIWGLSVYNESFTISSDGFISPFKDVRIYLSGIKLYDAKQLIKSKMARYVRFRPDDFDVSVLASRTINVNISGEVFNYGNFNISALNNAFNALVASGGPTNIGSVRKIQLKRSGESPKTLDIYKYLQDPIIGDDFFLQENDYIYVPVAEKVVEVIGAVNRPFKYELLANETLTDLIQYAGGLKSNALSRNIQIQRRVGDKLEIIDVNFDSSSSKNFKLRDGDVITIQEIESEVENFVSVEGAVEVPGLFSIEDNMRILDLVKKSKLKSNAITETVYIQRLNPDLITVRYEIINLKAAIDNPESSENILLQRGDKLTIKSLSNFREELSFVVEGAVRNGGEYPITDNGGLKVSDAIFLSGGLTKDALLDYAYIIRKRSPDSPDRDYIAVDLQKALEMHSSDANVNLEPNDKLVIYDKNEFNEEVFVEVGGEVYNPTALKYSTTLTLQDALRLAGGLKKESNPERINVYRVDFSDVNKTKVIAANLKLNDDLTIEGGAMFSLQPFDQIIVRKAPDFELLRNIVIEGEIKYPGKYALTKDNTKITDIIRDAGGLTNEAFAKGIKVFRKKDDIGFIIFDLSKAMRDPQSFNNIILQDGDIITLPKLNNLVSISGATKADELYTDDVAKTGTQTFPFEPGKDAKYYIEKYAGGVSELADKSKITVEYPNGEVKKVKRVLFFRNYPDVKPGSKIKVGYKKVETEKEKSEKEEIDWGKVLSNSIAQATTILSLILLIQNVD